MLMAKTMRSQVADVQSSPSGAEGRTYELPNYRRLQTQCWARWGKNSTSAELSLCPYESELSCDNSPARKVQGHSLIAWRSLTLLMGHDEPWWTQLHRCKQLVPEGVKDSWTVPWYTTLPHSVWNSSPLRGGTWIFPSKSEHSVQWISSTTLTGLPPPLTEQNNHQTLKFQHQTLVQDPMNCGYVPFYFHSFSCFSQFLSIFLYLTFTVKQKSIVLTSAYGLICISFWADESL